MVFEPDLVAIGNGGVSDEVAGPTVAVGVIGSGAGQVVDTFASGSTSVLLGPTSAWVLQRDTTSWVSNLGGPPTTPFTHVTRIDSASLQSTGALRFADPVQNAALLNDDILFDAVTSSSSDVARSVYLRAYDLGAPAAPTSLVSTQGFAAAACFGSGGAVLAYEPASAVGTLSVGAAALHGASWALPEMSVPGYRLDPTAIACSDDATLALLSVIGSANGSSHVLLVDVAAQSIVVDAPGLQGPLALRGDGGAGLALDSATQGLVYLDASSQVAVELPGQVALQQPWQTGSLTLWAVGEEASTLVVVDLSDGSAGAPFMAGSAPIVATWSAGPGFVVAQEADNGPGDVPLTQLDVLLKGQVTSLPLGTVLNGPSLAAVAGNTLFTLTSPVVNDNVDEGSDAAPPTMTTASVQVYDLVSGALTRTVPMPICDAADAEAMKGCSL